MANPTTNYGFVLPSPTDLVTDLPADFDVALQGVDTRLKALQPGTTLGDLAYSSATANTNTRLGVGTTGQVLTVAAGVPSWATPASGSMTLLSTTTLSGASTTISSIPTTYRNLRLEVVGWVPATNAKELKVQVNSDTATNYSANGFSQIFGTGSSFQGTEWINYFGVTWNQRASSAGTTNNFIFDFFDYTETTSVYRLGAFFGTYIGSTASADINVTGQLTYKNTGTAITSITLFPETTSNQSGTAYLYGVN